MTVRSRLFLNTHDGTAAILAAERRLGLELNEYIWPLPADELARVRAGTSARIAACDRLIMHGTLVSPDLEQVAAMDLASVRQIYEQAHESACLHQIGQIVFHSGYVPGKQAPRDWLRRSAAFWRSFLAEKPAGLSIYVENMVDDDPALLAELCEQVADHRLRLCLDVGHVHCHSSLPVRRWAEALGGKIGHVHLHNNDGAADRHWSLDRGTLDMDSVLQTLQHYAPAATYTLECAFLPSLDWLARRGYLRGLDESAEQA